MSDTAEVVDNSATPRRFQRVPATFAQQRLWFLEHLQPGSLAYLIAWRIDFSGELRVDVLERSLNEMVRRHKVFRTTFAEIDNSVVQVVASSLIIPLPLHDLSEKEDAEDLAREMAREESLRPIDLVKGPLLRASVLRLTGNEHVLLLTLHHIIFDGSSRSIFLSELSAIYDAFRAGVPSPLPEPRVQYADYAVWQRRSLQGKRYEKLLGYWKKQLADAPAALDLPLDRPRPAVEEFHGATKQFDLPDELSAKLKALAKQRGASLFMVLMAGFQTLLSKYSGQDDILVGIPVAGRTRTEFESLIGFFANQLVLRLNFSNDPSFNQLIEQMKNVSFDAFEHQEMPLDLLVQELNPERTLSHNPLFQVAFSLKSFQQSELRLAGIEKTKFSVTVGEVSKFDLSMLLTENGSELIGRLEYNVDLFDESTIDRLLAHYEVLLRSAVTHPESRVSQLPLITASERRQVLEEFNCTSVERKTVAVHEQIQAQAQKNPQSVALRFGQSEWTYRELNSRANQMAHFLMRKGAGPGSIVAVAMNRSPSLVAAILAVLKTGAAYVPFDPLLPAERVAGILVDADVKLTLTEESLLGMFSTAEVETVAVDNNSNLFDQAPDTDHDVFIAPNSLAYVLFTSGSTGRPKGCQIEHCNLSHYLGWASDYYFGEAEGGSFPLLTTLSFDLTVTSLFVPLLRGRTIFIQPQNAEITDVLANAFSTPGIDAVKLTPAHVSLLQSLELNGSAVSLAIVGGEAFTLEQAATLFRLNPAMKVFNEYGPTETTVGCIVELIRPSDTKILVGKPIENTCVYILDRYAQPVPVGLKGEIYIGGRGVGRGYLNRKELTQASFLNDPFVGGGRMYRTGDLGRWLPGGTVDYLGRADDQVKIRGFRIELGEIESVLSRYPGVRECVVMAREDEPGNKRLTAYIVPMAPAAAVDFGALQAFARPNLPDYMMPVAWMVMERLPLSPNGKVDRRALPAPVVDERQQRGDGGAPRTPIQELVAAIFEEALKIDFVGVQDNFFALGGHSLSAMQVVARAKRALKIDVPLRAVFESPTVAAFAEKIEALQRSELGLIMPPIVPVPRGRPLALSFAQQRLWFLAQMEPESPFYHVPWGLRLTGRLDVPALARALAEITARHDALRTHFEMGEEEPRQVIAASVELPLTLVNLSELPADEREDRALRLAGEDGERLFALSEGPLFRVLLVTLTEHDHLFLMTLHHAITDGWSQGVLANELAALYEAFHAGRESPLAALPVGYADYAVWQRRYLDEGGALAPQMRYWHQQLAGAPEALDFPIDRPRPPMQSFRGAKEVAFFPQELLDGVKTLSRREGTTLYMTLLAAFNVLLSRYAGQQDIVVGTVVAGRHHAETERIVGLFTNTLALRTDLSGEPSFRELLGRVRKTTLDAYVNQDAPFEKLVEELNPARDMSRSPIFQVLLVLANIPPTTRNLGEIEATQFSVQKQSSKFDLSLYVSEQPEGLRASFEYNTDLFDASTIQRMSGHFRRILEAVVAEPGLEVSRVPMLTEEEERQQLVAWNDTSQEYARDLKLETIFEQQVQRSPDARACIAGNKELTYRELNERSNQLAHFLMARGIGPTELVGVCLSRRESLLIALLGILKTGAAYLPLDPYYPQERLSYILEDAKTRLVVTEDSVREMVPGFEGEAFCMDSHWPDIAEHSKLNPAAVGGAEDLAYVLHTSGSTGKPKGVEITHRNLANFLLTMRKQPGMSADDRLLAVTTLSFDISGLELYLPLVTGACVVIASREATMDAAQLMDLMTRWNVSVMQATPATWQMLLEAGWSGDPELKILCGGEALPQDLAVKLVSNCRELWNMYGPTETTIWSSVSRIQRADVGRITVGRPIGNTTMYVLDDQRQLVPVGVAGELYIGGEGVGRGYWGKPELTAERFVADPFASGARMYRTGDLAKLLPDGTIQVLGRIDFQVKVRGHRIELGEIEAVLGQNDAVVECVVVVREDEAGDKRLVAYVVGRADAVVVSADLRRQVAERLPDYMVPSAIVVLEALPRTANGKIDRRALPAPDRQEDGPAFVAPRGLTEEILCEIWAEVLKQDRVGAEDNFFHLGGHSLLATRAVARIRQAFDVEVPLAALFEMPTVAGMAERIATLLRDGAGRSVPRMMKATDAVPTPLSYAQQRLWFLDQFEPDSAFYNVPWAVRLKGVLDEAALERALTELMTRHETLRTSFAVDGVGGEPVQVVSDEAELPLTKVGLASLPEEDRLEEARRLVGEEARKPFRLSVGPLFRALLVQLDEHDHVLLITLHHAISDGWSLGVLAAELAVLYEAFRTGEPSPLAPITLQYRDFSAWQRDYLAGGALAEQLDYWTRHLEGAPPSIDLPTDRPRPPVVTVEGSKRVAFVPAETLDGLKALGRKEGATLFITLLAAFDVLLSRYSGQQDLVIGTAVAGRETPETEKMIGSFANTLALRADLSGEPTFVELLRRVRAATLASYAHANLPFEKLVEELNPVRDMSRSPVFQVMFILQNAFERASTFGSLEAEAFAVAETDSKMDLILNVSERDGALRCAIEYNTALYDAETIDRLLEHYGAMLQRVVENPTQKITEVSFLSETESLQLLVEWNQTDTEYPRDKCVHRLIEDQAERTPQNIAAVFEDRALTYAELNGGANRLAHYLISCGVRNRDRVAVYVERSLQMLTALLAVQKCGAAYVPIDPGYPFERTRMVMEDAGVACLISEDRLLQEELMKNGPIVSLDRSAEAIAAQSEANPTVEMTSEDVMYVIFTSGSTGRPKGVVVPHRGVVNYLVWSCRYFGIGPGDVYPALATVTFDMSISELFAPLLVGATTLIASREVAADPERLAELLTLGRASVMIATPTTWSMLLDAGFTGEQMRRITGGEGLSRELFRRLMDAGKQAPLFNAYGPTEISVVCACHQFEDAEERVVIGRPPDNVQVYVLDKYLQPVPVGVHGNLHVAGDGVTKGYLGQPELTAQKFLDNPFSNRSKLYDTGDVVRHLRDGRIEYLGRSDLQVKIRGFRIELGEIESTLLQHPEVRECVVIAREDEPGNKVLAAYVVPIRADEPIDLEALRTHLRERLPAYMVPRAWMQMERLPMAATGKVDRRGLPSPTPPEAHGASESASLRSPIEELVAGIFCDVLRHERIGLEDNFFDYGGHSLSATQVMARLRHALALDVPLKTLFEEPTVAGLAGRLTEIQRSALGLTIPPIVPIARNRPLALSFAQQRLWFLAQMDPGNPLYNAPQAIRMKGTLVVAAFEQALDALVLRHEVLRTTFAVEGDEPVQVIAQAARVGLPLVDLSDLPEGERHAEAMRLLEVEAQKPFDLTTDAMLRALLVQLNEFEHILLLSTHHIATDGWSNAVLLRDLTELYAVELGLERPPLMPLAIQYADYAAWQRAWMQGEVLEKQLEFWRKTLAGAPSMLQLPTDRLRPAKQTYTAGMHRFEVPAELMGLLGKLGRREGATSFMLLLAAFKIVIYHYVKQPDIVLGTDLANRTTVQTEELIGFFVNLLAIRTDLSGDVTFRELLGRVRAGTLDAYAHQDVPFDKLVEELQPERSHSHNPLVQALFVQQNTPRSEASMEGLTLSSVPLSSPSKFDMAVFVRETGEGLKGSWQYNADLFDAATIEQMASLYLVVLKQVAQDADSRVGFIVDLLAAAQLQEAATAFEESREASRSKLKKTRRAAVSL